MERAIPIFAFHRVGPRTDCRFTVPPAEFERYLAVLGEEGYATLTCSDLVAVVLGRAAPPPRACLLTFDDGSADIWVYAVPLLQRHGMRATVFAVLDRLESSGGTRPTLEDVWSQRTAMAELYQLPALPEINARVLDPAHRPSTDHISVEEARAMIALGVCDVQSHGRDHMVHYSSDRLTGFLRPGSHWTALAAAHGDTRLGTPIYETSSVLVRPRFDDAPSVRDRLAGIVAGAGGPAFFTTPDWSERLQREFEAAVGAAGAGTLESNAEWSARVSSDLETCVRGLSAHAGRPVHSLAWPFGSSSEPSQALALRAGFTVGFTTRGGGYLPGLPRGGVGRIALKNVDAEGFRAALLQFSDPDQVRQHSAGGPSDGAIALAG